MSGPAFGDVADSGIDPLLQYKDIDQEYKNVPKRDVAYRKSVDDTKKCGNCRYFIEPNACKRIEGHIETEFVCNLWELNKPQVSGIISKFLNGF